MWCPICKKEYSVSVRKCPECGAHMKKEPPKSAVADWVLSFKDSLSDNWPYLENGQPEKAALLAHRTAVNMEDKLLVNMLSAFDIPVITNYPGDGGAGKVILGMSAYGTDIYVPESFLVEAQALLEGTIDD